MNLPKRRNVNQVKNETIFNFVSSPRQGYFSKNGSVEKAIEPSRLQQYQVYNVIGKGAYGQVRLAKNTNDKQYYAIKMVIIVHENQISKQLIKRHRAQDHIQQEIENQKILANPNIVKFIDSFDDQEFIYIVLEYCPGGDLGQMLKAKKVLKLQEAFLYFYQMCIAVDYLHNNRIVHRDLKPENILVFNEKQIKLCDFNWSARLNDSFQVQPALCGTVDYMAPEAMTRNPQDIKIDIWGLGILLYQMLHGDVPFRSQQMMEQSSSILKNRHLVLDPKLPNGLAQLIRKLLACNPINRPNTRQIFKNEWMEQMITSNQLRNPYQQLKLSEPLFVQNIYSQIQQQNRLPKLLIILVIVDLLNQWKFELDKLISLEVKIRLFNNETNTNLIKHASDKSKSFAKSVVWTVPNSIGVNVDQNPNQDWLKDDVGPSKVCFWCGVGREKMSKYADFSQMTQSNWTF